MALPPCPNPVGDEHTEFLGAVASPSESQPPGSHHFGMRFFLPFPWLPFLHSLAALSCAGTQQLLFGKKLCARINMIFGLVSIDDHLAVVTNGFDILQKHKVSAIY